MIIVRTQMRRLVDLYITVIIMRLMKRRTK